VRRAKQKFFKFSKPALREVAVSLLEEAKDGVVEEATHSRWKEFLKSLVLIKKTQE